MFEYSNGKVKAHSINKLRQAAEINGRIFMRISKQGLVEWKKGQIKPIPGGEKFINSSLRAVLPHGNELMIVSNEGDLFSYNDRELTKIKTDIDDFLKSNTIISAIKLNDGNYAFGLSAKGLVIINEAGELIQHIDIKFGLPSDVITYILQTKDNNLWLSTFNGISHLMTSLPVTNIKEEFNLNSAIYTSILYEDNLFVGSSSGVYLSEWKDSKKDIKKGKVFELVGTPSQYMAN
ncbi:MAG: hypothetical protein HC831_26100 [Chloroflexia bacterium]|nr:hypothetical protein [Chloroflexia bacterium]